MSIQSKKLIEEAKKLIEIGHELSEYGKSNDGYTADEQIQKFTLWANRSGEFIYRVKEKNSEQALTFKNFRLNQGMSNLHSNNYKRILEVNGALESIVYELENGLLSNIRVLLQADIFSDFLEMGEHLLKEGYKDAGAVIIGSVLEDTLRKLCSTNEIETINAKGNPLTIDPLNSELAKADVYNKLVQKQITSWADLRNNAAHGHFDKYDTTQVEMMLRFVQSFCAVHLK
jgi:hypothetical protein